MRIKIIQINIWKGNFLDALVAFLREEHPDVITMQEVTSGRENLHADKTLDLFLYLKHALGMQGTLAPKFFSDPQSYLGNAVLTTYPIISQNVFWLKQYQGFLPSEEGFQKRVESCNVLDVIVKADSSMPFHILSTHGAWTREPVDTPEKVRQARALADYLKGLGGAPFLLGGDFNMPPGTKVISLLDEVAQNTLYDSKITRTTHPGIHKTAAFKPEGLLIDFIFTSPHFRVARIDAPAVTVSDHLPVRAELLLD